MERSGIIHRMRKGEIRVLIATNVASRGLDIPAIKVVVNFDCAKEKEEHIHRVGRTGRGGNKDGVAYTLISGEEKRQAAMMVRILEQSNQVVSEDLMQLAMTDPNFKKSRVSIGVGNFSMKVNLKKEERKMKANHKKIGDRTGIGFSGPST